MKAKNVSNTELFRCPFCRIITPAQEMIDHAETEYGITDFRISRKESMPVCSSCKGLNKKCAECMGTGCVIKKKSKTGRHVLCPICKQSFEGASLYAHLIDMHSKRIISLKNIKRPGRADRDGFSEKDNEIRQEEPNADLKRRINNRKVAIRRGLVLEGGGRRSLVK